MLSVCIFLMTLSLLVIGAVIFAFRRVARLERSLDELGGRCGDRLECLERAVLALEEDADAAPETRADDRIKAREAERRFTEGVANILSFSCTAAGRRSE